MPEAKRKQVSPKRRSFLQSKTPPQRRRLTSGNIKFKRRLCDMGNRMGAFVSGLRYGPQQQKLGKDAKILSDLYFFPFSLL